MSQLSPDASALLMILSGPPRRAHELKSQVNWPEQRFNAALSQLVNSYPPQIEVFGDAMDQYLVRADDDYEEDK